MGSLTRFVSNSVLTGFIAGAALLIVIGQLGNLTSYKLPREESQIFAILYLILHAGEIQPQALAIGLLNIALVPVIFPVVALVGDIAHIPAGLPVPAAPISPSLSSGS